MPAVRVMRALAWAPRCGLLSIRQWVCYLCGETGYARDEIESGAAFQKHYRREHYRRGHAG